LLPVSLSAQQRSSAIEERDANAPTPEDAPGDVEPEDSDPAQAEGSGGCHPKAEQDTCHDNARVAEDRVGETSEWLGQPFIFDRANAGAL